MDTVARNIYPSAPFDSHFKHFTLSIKPNEIFQIILFTLRITDLFFYANLSSPLSLLFPSYPFLPNPILIPNPKLSSRVVRGQLPPPSLNDFDFVCKRTDTVSLLVR